MCLLHFFGGQKVDAGLSSALVGMGSEALLRICHDRSGLEDLEAAMVHSYSHISCFLQKRSRKCVNFTPYCCIAAVGLEICLESSVLAVKGKSRRDEPKC